MNVREIRALLELLREYGLSEMEIEREGVRLRLRRETGVPAPPPPLTPSPPPAAVPAREAPRVAALTVDAPMVGTFYRASAPDAQPYVREGDVVKKGQVVGIIEAMKLMNEIESTTPGRIVKVLADNAQPVEYGQPLFLLEP